MKLTIEEELLLHKIQTGKDEALQTLIDGLQEISYEEGYAAGLDEGQLQGRAACREDALGLISDAKEALDSIGEL